MYSSIHVSNYSLTKFLVLKEEINPVFKIRDYSFQIDGNDPSFQHLSLDVLHAVVSTELWF